MKSRLEICPLALLLLLVLPAVARPVPGALVLAPHEGSGELEVSRAAVRSAPPGVAGAPELRTRGVTLLGRAPEAVTLLVESVGLTGDLPTAADNDFTRIDEAIQAVALLGNGTTVRLAGTFDWSEPHAFAAWEAVDYSILAPPGIANVTIRAAALGDAVIVGPGELPDADVYYEGFLLLWGGTFHGWTIENLVVRDFDWPIGCFFTATGDFNGLTIRNNRIEMLPDLPGSFSGPVGEPWQNIALHLSFGLGQTIEGNEFVVPGDAAGDDSDPANPLLAATVVMQSNTSGGSHYNGLRILNNVVRVTGAQAAIPERVYGIWENGAAHASNIEIRGNVFRNEHPDNDPALNFQRGFRVTSHSSATSTVSYVANRVEGATVGIGWLEYSSPVAPPATVWPVVVEGNTLLGNQIGIWVFTDSLGTVANPRMSKAIVRYNRMAGNATGLRDDDAEVMAENNWFGCSEGPGAAGCDPALYSGTAGFFDADPWLTLGIELGAPSVEVGATVAATATVTGNSAGADLGAIPFPVADVAFAGVKGTMPTPVATADGTSVSSFTGTAVGIGSATAQLDSAAASAQLLVTQGGTVVVQALSETGGTPSALDNDYTRINDVVQLVADGSTVELVGTFDWTEPHAAASWAAGSDGILGTGDDYACAAPGGFENVTIRAAAPGGAVIQGPGDLPEVDLESFLGMWDGFYDGWTVENLDIRGFDLGIGMFFSGGTFSGVTIRNNRIEVPADLNATVAPDDVNQNIAIHLAIGVHQTIEGNEIVLAGDGVSDTVGNKRAASVALQSNTHGGSAYDRLRIVNNVIRVTGEQSADPEWIYGIWENGHAHGSTIDIGGNAFLNEDANNDPLLNRQRAFVVTSHFGVLGNLVTYADNWVEGANIGIHWIADSGFGGAVFFTGNTLLGNGTGVWVQDGVRSGSHARLRFNRIFGNGVGMQSDEMEVLAENNWWGCNAGPGGAGCDTAAYNGTAGLFDVDPWLTLGIALGSSTLQLGDSTGVTASLRMNSDGVDTSVAGFLPDGIPVAFGATGGTVDPAADLTVQSLAGSTFTAGSLPGSFAVSVEVDGQLVSTPVTLFAPEADLFATLAPELQVVSAGSAVAWTATFGNDGPAEASGVGIALAFAPELTGVAWTCSATGGAVCPAASGAGGVTATVDLPSGGSLQYAVTGAAPTPFAGVLAVTATVTAPVTISDPDPTNDVAVATVRSPDLFEDGFESGDLGAWSGSL